MQSKLLTTSLSLLRQNSRFQSVFFYAVKGLIFLLLAFPSTTHPALTQNLFPNGDLNSVYAHLGWWSGLHKAKQISGIFFLRIWKFCSYLSLSSATLRVVGFFSRENDLEAVIRRATRTRWTNSNWGSCTTTATNGQNFGAVILVISAAPGTMDRICAYAPRLKATEAYKCRVYNACKVLKESKHLKGEDQ